jgi:NAD-dependent DNA ligase
MVRKKKLNPSGEKGKDGKYHNAHLSLNEDELKAAGLNIGDAVFVRVRGDMIIIQKAENWPHREEIEIRRLNRNSVGK